MAAAGGARNSPRGLWYQYLRTLEALMDAAEDPGRSIAAVHVERLPGPDGADVESIDFGLSDASGRVLSAAQVKSRAPGTVMGAGQVFSALAHMAEKRDAARYELLTSAEPGDSALELLAVLGTGLSPGELKAAVAEILARVPGKAGRLLDGLDDEQVARLGRATARFDPRDDTEITESLRWRLRRYRDQSRSGLGSESAGLMIGYLVSEIFRRAGHPAEATVSLSRFRSLLLADGAVVAQVLGRRDWGVVVGIPPRAPDVRRADVLDRIVAALPVRDGAGAVAQCTLTGLSGIGKSSLAVGYLLERADLYDVILWADGESEKTLASSFSRIFRHFRGAVAPVPGDPDVVRDCVLTDLSCSLGRWLLILDNSTDERLSDSWVPRAGNGHVIMTTLDSAGTPQGDTRIEVGGMSTAQAVELVRLRIEAAEQPGGPVPGLLARLARELEGWPLALELACAYLRNGYGAEGIPEYLERLKRASLSDPGAVPRSYRATLRQAVELCLERILQIADGPDARSARTAAVAVRVLVVASYVSSRRIPVYLMTAVLEIGPGDEPFRTSNPLVVDDSASPAAAVVQLLRRFSLVSPDGRLPPDGTAGPGEGRYDSAIAVNSVLQEVVRDIYDSSPFAGPVTDRLAWHTERWMQAAFALRAHERALVLAAHASAVEGHAGRLGIATDAVAYLRGNLASILAHQNRAEEAIRLLRAEIGHFRGRSDENARDLTCQACMQLAAVLADDTDTPGDEIAGLLETSYLIALGYVPGAPEAAAVLTSRLCSVLNHLELIGVRHGRLEMLATAVRDLAGRLPATPQSAAAHAVDEIETCLDGHRDLPRAAALASSLLASDFIKWGTQESVQLKVRAQKCLIEALAVKRGMAGALAVVDGFTEDTRSSPLFAREIMKLVLNGGYVAARYSLIGLPRADELLARLLSDGRAETVQSAYPDQTADRVRLLAGVDAYHHSDLPTARDRAAGFLESQALSGAQTAPEEGWGELARVLADAVAARQGGAESPGPAARLHGSARGLLPLLSPAVRDTLVSCTADVRQPAVVPDHVVQFGFLARGEPAQQVPGDTAERPGDHQVDHPAQRRGARDCRLEAARVEEAADAVPVRQVLNVEQDHHHGVAEQAGADPGQRDQQPEGQVQRGVAVTDDVRLLGGPAAGRQP